MAVKRTSGVSPIISSIDRRVKTVESAQSTLNAQYANAVSVSVPDDDNPDVNAPDITSGVDKKYEYKRVLKAYIYGAKVTGNGSRCELYFGENPDIEKDGPVDVQGVHGTSADNFNISPKQFKVLAIDSSPWNDDVRATQPWRNTPSTGNNGDTITNTVWFNPVVEVPSSYSRTSGRELITTRRIDTVDIDGSTVTVNLNSTHRFELGDIISVDLPAPAFGIDGLFRISEVPDTSTIVYELDSPIGSPVTLDSSDFTGGEAYVYPVARRYVKDGTVWIDKDASPNKVWVWNVLRWYDTAESPLSQVPGADSVSPSPVTNLVPSSATQTVPTAGAVGRASITLTWDAPTTNENGTPLTDLAGYYVWWRYGTLEEWRFSTIDDPEVTTWYQEDFIYNVPVYLAVYAFDKSGNRSTATTTSITTAASPAPELKAPAAPSVTGYLGTMKVFWNGLDADGNAAHISAYEVELHISTSSNFTADSSTLYERFPAINGPTYTVIPGNAIIAGAEIQDNQTYYFKFKFIDVWGNRTGQSAEASFVGQKSNIVTFDMIDVGTVDGEVLIGAEIRTSVNPTATDGTGGGVVLDDSGFTAYNAAGLQSFNINFATGNVFIPGNGAITIANYATSQRVGEVEAIAIAANGIAVTANSTANFANGVSQNALQQVSITAAGLTATNAIVTTQGQTITNVYNQANLTANGLTVVSGVANTAANTANAAIETANTAQQTATLTANGLSITNAIVNGQGNVINVISETEVGSGTIKLRRSQVVGSINNSISDTTTINGGVITTGSITANLIEADAISAYIFQGREIRLSAFEDNRNPKISLTKDRIAAFNSSNQPTFRILASGDIFADDISINTARLTGSITVTGNITTTTGSIRTASSGQRVVLDGATDSLKFYGTDNNEKGEIFGGTTNLGLNAPSGIALQASGSTVLTVNTNGLFITPGKTVNSALSVDNNITSTGSVSSSTFIRAGSTSFSTLHSNGGISSSGGATPSTGQINAGTSLRSGTTVIVGVMNTGTTAVPIVRWNGADTSLLITSSDARLKAEVEPILDGLSIVNQLNPITFIAAGAADTPGRSPGFIAQQVEQVFSGDVKIVSELPDTSVAEDFDLSEGPLKTFNYETLVPYLVKAVQELSAKNDALEARLAALEGNG